MADMLKTGLAFLTTQLTTHASQPIVYRRESDAATVQAVFGQKLLRIEGMAGDLRVEWTDMDFCIPTVDLVLCGEPIEPKEGDQVDILLDDGGTETFQVYRFGEDVAWRYADPHRSMVRVHTKLINSERLC